MLNMLLKKNDAALREQVVLLLFGHMLCFSQVMICTQSHEERVVKFATYTHNPYIHIVFFLSFKSNLWLWLQNSNVCGWIGGTDLRLG